jgi:REP element-mobilizing transposase RayT
VTLRAHRAELPSLRGAAPFAAIERALRGVLDRPGVRVVHFSVQSNHVHLLVEAGDARALSRGVQASAIRAARGPNAVLGRRGPVWSDRHHARAVGAR